MKQTLLFLLVTVPIFARPEGAPPGNTGAPGNNTCAQCHRTFPLNPPGGSIRIQAVNYKPGQAQTLRVTVSHPEAQRWGFQIAARWAKDPTQNVGRFNAPSGDVQVQTGGYATHTLAGTTSSGASGAKTFEVEWVAPEGTDDSDVIFYAAGNAANNNAGSGTGSQGDRIYTTQTRIQAEMSCAFSERPVITDVIDAASFNKAASARAILTIKGRNFGVVNTRRDATQGYVRDNNFPKELGCIAVEIGGERAPLLYVSDQQINVQVPALTMLGDVPVRVIINASGPSAAIMSDPATTTLRAASPAFFTFNGLSVAARIAGSATIVADPALVPGARRARPGEVVELYGTGLGPTQTPVAPGALAPNEAISTAQKVAVSIGNTRLTDEDILYSGLAPGNISGLYQINVRIPASASNGDLPIAMAVGSDQSVAGTTIPISTQ